MPTDAAALPAGATAPASAKRRSAAKARALATLRAAALRLAEHALVGPALGQGGGRRQMAGLVGRLALSAQTVAVRDSVARTRHGAAPWRS